ncbi:peptidyl-prolyl cis-trans isomerase cyp5 [Stylonychia lemnae]|uniref:Peptidyl-prolyl cis-trans isomerase n=1 Tax=Stylonychia lemnae TaxID=5949 RepID=A0A077ZTM1_STYLE|nr:peptidyl-prolyl cis-trans isomerase cyp5 [Stylonychia lemnae]|eukprot:CDW73242.1 peptidyl-prolyl cis-trans isomerase cyp5 [Stylonychia lemnae]
MQKFLQHNRRQLLQFSARNFQAGVIQYRNPANPWVYLQLSRDGDDIGRMTFEVKSLLHFIQTQLYAHLAPKTVENFRSLCVGDNEPNRLSYKKCPIHRIIGGFMAQGGDFENGDGTGGKSIYGGKFRDEVRNIEHYKRGMLSMANTGPNSNGSQFFVTFGPTDWLDGYHVVFGELIEGEQTLMLLELAGSKSGTPTSKVVIEDCGMIYRQ